MPQNGDDSDASNPLLGDAIVVGAQVVVALQMVVEEVFVGTRKVHPLAVVGWEGWFGFFVLSFLLIPFYYIKAPSLSSLPEHRLEDPIDGFIQMGNDYKIIIWTLVNVCSISFFNFSGVSVTKELNATTRMVLDSLRNIVVWIFSLAIGWEEFQYLQLIGFLVLFLGTCIYNDIFIFPLLRKYNLLPKILDHVKETPETTPILRSEEEL